MVDFNKLLEEMRTRTPEQAAQAREEVEASYERQTQAQIDTLTEQVRKAETLLPVLTPDERRFVASMQLRADRPGRYTKRAGGDLLSLSDGQKEYLQRLALRAQQPRPAPGSRAERYGRQRG
ncbi:hypothetical protein [Ramlibacter sp. AN1133]|uniref:hypothetical protein n=1 Tax=Ramlibacter sp. AN1133 TaxID=3133429 RepID=UPI0030BB5CC7